MTSLETNYTVVSELFRNFDDAEYTRWLLKASQLQRFLSFSRVPIDSFPFVSTHNSFNFDAAVTSHMHFEVVSNQIYDITYQLECLGVRGIEIDVHYIESIARFPGDPKAMKVCHANPNSSARVYKNCSKLPVWICDWINIENFGPEDTGCSRKAPTFREVLYQVAVWLNKTENSSEFIYVKLETYLGNYQEVLSNEIASVFNPAKVLTRDDIINSSGWPTVEYIVTVLKKNIGFFSLVRDEESALVIGKKEVAFPPSDLKIGKCPYQNFNSKRMQGDAVSIEFKIAGLVMYRRPPPMSDRMDSSIVPLALDCSVNPTFDRMDREKLESTIWSWAVEYPLANVSGHRCTIVSVIKQGRWSDIDCKLATLFDLACVSTKSRSNWVIESPNNDNNPDSKSCSEGYIFGTPATFTENRFLLKAMHRAKISHVRVSMESTVTGCWSIESKPDLCLSFSTAQFDGAPPKCLI